MMIPRIFTIMNNEVDKKGNNCLQGLTLEQLLLDLSNYIGWEKMSHKIPINCFLKDPSIKSSLAFLRKTPWARKKVEIMYEFNYKKIQQAKKSAEELN